MKAPVSRTALLATALGLAGTAAAIPMTGTVLDNSYVHCGSTITGCGNHLAIDPGQTFSFEIHDDMFIVAEDSVVEFSLNGGAATLQMLELFVRIDRSEPDSFRYGRFSYSLYGDNLNGNSAVGFSKFWFLNENNGDFNSIAWDGGDFTSYLWGGDSRYSTITGGNDQGLGLSFVFRGNDGIGDDHGLDGNGDGGNGDPTVPEPGTLFLFGLGLIGLAFGRRT